MCILLCIKNSLNEKVTVGNEYITHNKQDAKYYQIIDDENNTVMIPATDFECLYYLDDKDINDLDKDDETISEISQTEMKDVSKLFEFNIEPEYSQEFIHEKLIPAIYENNKDVNMLVSRAYGGNTLNKN